MPISARHASVARPHLSTVPRNFRGFSILEQPPRASHPIRVVSRANDDHMIDEPKGHGTVGLPSKIRRFFRRLEHAERSADECLDSILGDAVQRRKTVLPWMERVPNADAPMASASGACLRPLGSTAEQFCICHLQFLSREIIRHPPARRSPLRTHWLGAMPICSSLAPYPDPRCGHACETRRSRGRPACATIPTPGGHPCRASSSRAGNRCQPWSCKEIRAKPPSYSRDITLPCPPCRHGARKSGSQP